MDFPCHSHLQSSKLLLFFVKEIFQLHEDCYSNKELALYFFLAMKKSPFFDRQINLFLEKQFRCNLYMKILNF